MMSTWSAERASGTYTFENQELRPDQSQPFARCMRIFGEPTDLAPLIAEWRSSERGWYPPEEISPTGQRRPLLISLPT